MSIECESLGQNSSERYFLLSEIEQLTQVTALDELDQSSSALFSRSDAASGGTICILYLLWRFENHSVSDIFAGLQRMHSNDRLNSDQFLLSVEMLVPNESSFPAAKAAFLELQQKFHEILPKCFIVAGVANKDAATPALEKILDVLQRVHDSCETLELSETEAQRLVKVIAPYRQNFLGHEPLREPDACGFVMQQLLYSSKESYNNWINAAIDRFKRRILEGRNSASSIQELAKIRQQQGDHFLFVQLIGVALAVASAVFLLLWRS